jgi:NADH-quinone oxidoreductase subunit I
MMSGGKDFFARAGDLLPPARAALSCGLCRKLYNQKGKADIRISLLGRCEAPMQTWLRSFSAWFQNIVQAVKTVAQGMDITLWYLLQTFRRKTFTERFEYPELPVPVKPRYRGFHRFDLTTCIGCDKCARACPVDCIYIDKIKNPVGKGFRVNGFTIDYTKCMFCALCVDPCPVDCIFMGSTYDQSCFSRDGCVVDFAKLPVEIAWGQATLNPTAVAASKLETEPVWTKPPDPEKPAAAAAKK